MTPVPTPRTSDPQKTGHIHCPLILQETANRLHRQVRKTLADSSHQLQAIIGTLLYYARAVDPTLLPIANELASQQANATRRIFNAANRALSYCAAHSDNQITYHACDMVLHAFANASYLCRSHARSVAGAIFFLGNHNDPTRINGAIHVCYNGARAKAYSSVDA